MGFGADVILVQTDFWRSSAHVTDSDAKRIAWALRHAGGVSLATAATTALSFFANMASAVRALRHFIFLMGLCVIFAWVLIVFTYTQLCLVAERHGRQLLPHKITKLFAKLSLNAAALTWNLKRICRSGSAASGPTRRACRP